MTEAALCLVGPTGAGKTEAALALARAVNAAVVNVDSRQVYRGVPITTAQPAPEEARQCPHLLYGFLDLDQSLSAGSYAVLVAEAAARMFGEGRAPILVGGTGLYLRAVLEGLAAMPEVPASVRRELARQWEFEGPKAMHDRLARVDPDYAARIHPNDRQRVTRALEVHQVSGVAFSAWHAKAVPALDAPCLKLGLRMDRELLRQRLARRIGDMLERGALEEMRQAVACCPDPSAPGLTGIGCAELAAHLRGEMSLERARALWLTNTRAYAKRQMTWFNREPDIQWFGPDQIDQMVGVASRWLGLGG